MSCFPDHHHFVILSTTIVILSTPVVILSETKDLVARRAKCFQIEPAARHPELGALPNDRQQKTKPFDYQPLDAPLTTNASISRTHNGLCPISDLELAQDIRDVISYCFEAENQLPSNRCVVLTLRD